MALYTQLGTGLATCSFCREKIEVGTIHLKFQGYNSSNCCHIQCAFNNPVLVNRKLEKEWIKENKTRCKTKYYKHSDIICKSVCKIPGAKVFEVIKDNRTGTWKKGELFTLPDQAKLDEEISEHEIPLYILEDK